MAKSLFHSLFLLFPFLLLGQKTPAQQTKYDLAEAVKQNLISLHAEGAGGHQGECLKVVLKNLHGKPLRVHIPQGQFMEPSDSSFQTLVVAQEQTLVVGTRVPAEAVLTTFCAEAGDRSPLAGAAFTVGALGAGHLRSLLKYIVEKGKLGNSEAQAAVWCITSGGSLGSIGDAELTKFTADLLGKDIPGYKIKYQTVQAVPGERAALGKALVVEGNYRYYLEKDEKLVMNLLDADSKLIKQISKEELMKAGEHRSSFHLQVWNLPPGKYIVRIQTKDARVLKDIEVEF